MKKISALDNAQMLVDMLGDDRMDEMMKVACRAGRAILLAGVKAAVAEVATNPSLLKDLKEAARLNAAIEGDARARHLERQWESGDLEGAARSVLMDPAGHALHLITRGECSGAYISGKDGGPDRRIEVTRVGDRLSFAGVERSGSKTARGWKFGPVETFESLLTACGQAAAWLDGGK
jgi:hypothetical protein